MEYSKEKTLKALSNVDITASDFKANPFTFYETLRRDAPVFPVNIKIASYSTRAWLITRYDDVLSVLNDSTNFVKDPRAAMTEQQFRATPFSRLPRTIKMLQNSLLNLDGYDHDRLKKLVHHAFSPRFVERIRAYTEALAEEILIGAMKKGEMELVEKFALVIPNRVIGRILGIPDKDYGRLVWWTKAFRLTGRQASSFPCADIYGFSLLSGWTYKTKTI